MITKIIIWFWNRSYTTILWQTLTYNWLAEPRPFSVYHHKPWHQHKGRGYLSFFLAGGSLPCTQKQLPPSYQQPLCVLLYASFHAKQFTHIISCDPYYSPWSRNYHSILHMRKPRLRENRQLAVKWLSQILVCRQSSCNNSHIAQPWEHRLKKGEAQVPPDFTLLETVTLSKSRSFKIFLPLTAKLRAKSCRSSRAHPLENIFGIQGPWNMLKHVPWCLLQAEAGNSYLGRLSSPIGQHENG